MSQKLLPFSWYGGKFSHLNFLLPLIDGVAHQTYVESFGGSAAVLLNKRPSPVEVYNDAYGDVVNFFRVLREHGPALKDLLELTPYSREEFTEACGPLAGKDQVEAARLFFVRARQIRSGLATVATPGKWCFDVKNSRRGIGLGASRWLSSIEGLTEVIERLRTVQVEHLDALDVMARYDSDQTLHYVDPPYVTATRSGGKAYALEYTDAQHTALLSSLQTLRGKVILSGYESPLYAERLKGWALIKAPAKNAASTRVNSSGEERSEVVWVKGANGIVRDVAA